MQLDLHNGNTYEPDKDSQYQISGAPSGGQMLDAQKPKEEKNSHPSTEVDTLPLYRQTYRDPSDDRRQRLDERIELHRRLALPLGVHPAVAGGGAAGDHLTARGEIGRGGADCRDRVDLLHRPDQLHQPGAAGHAASGSRGMAAERLCSRSSPWS